LTLNVDGRVIRLQRKCVSSNVRRVIASDNVCIESRSIDSVPITLTYTSLRTPRSNWLIESKLVNERALQARSMFSDEAKSVVRVLNPSTDSITVKRGYCFGNAEPINFHCVVCGEVCMCSPAMYSGTSVKTRAIAQVQSSGRVDRHPDAGCGSAPGENESVSNDVRVCAADASVAAAGGDECDRGGEQGNSAASNNHELIKPMLESLPDCIDASQRAQIEALLLRNVDLFARYEYDVGLTNLMQYRLELKDPRAPPVCEPLRQHPIADLDLIDNEVD
jgi:hypothetical protein